MCITVNAFDCATILIRVLHFPKQQVLVECYCIYQFILMVEQTKANREMAARGVPPTNVPITVQYGPLPGQTYMTSCARNNKEAAAEYRLYSEYTRDLIRVQCPRLLVAHLATTAIKEGRAAMDVYEEWHLRHSVCVGDLPLE